MSFRYAANPSLKNSFFTCLRKVRLFGRRRLHTKQHHCNQKLPCGIPAKRCPREAVPRKTVPARNGFLRNNTPRSGTPRSGPLRNGVLGYVFRGFACDLWTRSLYTYLDEKGLAGRLGLKLMFSPTKFTLESKT